MSTTIVISTFVLLLLVSSVYNTATFDFFNGVDVVEDQVFVDLSPFTITAFVNPRQYGYGMIASKDRSGADPNQFRLELHDDGHVALFFDGIEVHNNVPGSPDPSGFVSALTTPSPIPINAYTHIALVRSGIQFALYVNGKLSSKVAALRYANHSNTVNFRIGSRYNQAGNGAINLFPGIIRNAAYYNQNFTDAEVLRSFQYNGQDVGDIGGAKGTSFNDAPRVTRIVVGLANATDVYGISSLQTFWGSVPGTKHGDYFGVAKQVPFDLNVNEVITGAVVQYNEFVQSIQFVTNQRVSIVYGKNNGTSATLVLPPGTVFSGFFGKAGWAIDSVGLNYVYVSEYVIVPPPSNATADIMKIHLR